MSNLGSSETVSRSPTRGALRSIDPDELVSSAVAAKQLGVKQQTLTAWRCEHRGPAFIKIGRAVWYRRADIAAFIGAQRCEPGMEGA
jgi:hypothetical protein